MKRYSDRLVFLCGPKSIGVCRIVLCLGIYIAALLMYPAVWSVVGYMYTVSLNFSIEYAIVGGFLAVLLLVCSNFKSLIYRSAIDIMVLGVYLPIAVVSSSLSNWISVVFIAAASILTTIAAIFGLMRRPVSLMLENGMQFGPSVSLVAKMIFSGCLVLAFYMVLVNFEQIHFDLAYTYYNAYTIRAEARADGLLGYILGSFTILCFPFLVYHGVNEKRFFPLVVGLTVAVLVYQVFAIKVFLLNFLLVLFFGGFFAYTKVLRNLSVYVFYILLFLGSFIANQRLYPLLDRFFYLVGLNTLYYFDFFSKNPLRFFEGTKIDLGLSSYELEPGLIIDAIYYQGKGTNQSAGYLPTIYADLGLVGVFLSAVLLGLIFVMLHSLRTKSELLSFLVAVSLGFSLLNSTFNMLFFSNGLSVLLLIACFVRGASKPACKGAVLCRLR